MLCVGKCLHVSLLLCSLYLCRSLFRPAFLVPPIPHVLSSVVHSLCFFVCVFFMHIIYYTYSGILHDVCFVLWLVVWGHMAYMRCDWWKWSHDPYLSCDWLREVTWSLAGGTVNMQTLCLNPLMPHNALIAPNLGKLSQIVNKWVTLLCTRVVQVRVAAR